jgi:hypothetical protein
MKNLYLTTILALLTIATFAQTKTIVGIMPFNSPTNNDGYYNQRDNQNKNVIAIQDAVSDAFLNAKRFTLVEREKMALIKGEKKNQQSEDYIDGQTVEQSKSMGASYIVTGNVTEASFEEQNQSLGYGGLSIPSRKAVISFNIKVIDVSTGEIMASERFSSEAKGKNGFDDALNIIKPNIEKFIKGNFKITISIANIEEKNATNEATKVLISGGTGIGLKPQSVLKVFELTTLTVDGRKISRRKEIAQIMVENVEDENFSICKVISGGATITTRTEAGANLKCEIITE